MKKFTKGYTSNAMVITDTKEFMAITIEKYYWLPRLRFIWNTLYKANRQLSVFQSYDFMYELWKNSPVYWLMNKEWPIFYLVRDKGKPCLIAPLCRKSNGTFEIMGNKNGCEYCDLIYAEGAELRRYVGKLLEYLNSSISFVRVKEESLLYKTFVDESNMKPIGDDKCTNIFLPNSYEEYYKGLSSSMRQNLRTAFNRLKREGHDVRVRVITPEGKCVSWGYDEMEAVQQDSVTYHVAQETETTATEDFDQMLALYYQRHAERYGENTSKMKMWYVKHLNFVTKSLQKLHSAMNVMLYIDNELAAFMGGFSNQGDGGYVVPRLSIQGTYGFYSPGMLLVNETARYLIDRTDKRNLDLSLGTESYKVKMGGGNMLQCALS